MLLMLVVSLYTSRVVLSTLGVEDFGIYSAVAGFVSMVGFINGAMAFATQRFLSFEIGRKDGSQLRQVFIMSVSIHFFIALFLFLVAESLGLWFVNTKLIYPLDRMDAVQWVYQFSVLVLMVNIISVPYNAIIIAYERMNVYAGFSIVEVSLKLAIVFMLQWFGYDKLKLYAVLTFVVSFIIRLAYVIYCRYKFNESKFRLFWNKQLFITLLSYSGWNLFGNVADVAKGQGLNVLLNMFFGPIVNASYSIAYQVRNAVQQFVSNFQLAINPQIIKAYASNDLSKMHQLVFRGAKYSFFLLFTISLPVFIEAERVLQIWLINVPDYTVVFTRLVIINLLIDSISGTLLTAAHASGRIKLYQILTGGLLVTILPFSLLFLRFGSPPQSTFIVSIFISVLALVGRVLIVRKLVKLNAVLFLRNVVLRSLLVGLVATILPFAVYISIDSSLIRLFLIGVSSLISTFCTVYLIGLDKTERSFFVGLVRKYFNRLYS